MKSEENNSIMFVAHEHDDSSSSPTPSGEVVIPLHKVGVHLISSY